MPTTPTLSGEFAILFTFSFLILFCYIGDLYHGAVFFDYPHYAYNRLAQENGIPTYEYYFSKQNGRIGSWHSGEEVYLYGNIPEKSGLYTDADRELSRAMKQYYLNFIRTGDPNGEGLADFPENKDSKTYLEFGESGVAPKTESERKLGLFAILDRMQGGSKE